jgi:hypothetical protein
MEDPERLGATEAGRSTLANYPSGYKDLVSKTSIVKAIVGSNPTFAAQGGADPPLLSRL